MSDRGRVVLAYSGGLDTSVILKWLTLRGHEVVAYVADVGQKDDFERVREKALATGASKVRVEDLKEEFVTDFIFPAFQANAIYEGRYLLGTALARPVIARRHIQLAHEEDAAFVAHGATGKGNDQVRLELAYYALDPGIGVLAPWKMREFLETFRGRPDMLEFAREHGIEIRATTKKPYSEDENLLHISHEAGVLEDPAFEPDEDVFSRTVSPEAAPDRPTRIAIDFEDGIPTRVTNRDDGTTVTGPLPLFMYLNEVGAANGIGRLDIVENRYIGLKSRGVYETPGGAILHEAHRDIESIAMDREVMRLRDMLSAKLSQLIYNGFWFSPEMEFLMAAVAKSQEAIDGRVFVKLLKGHVFVTGRESPSSLYDRDLASMDIEGGFRQEDAAGFIRIHAIRLRAHRAIMSRRERSREAEGD